MNLFHGLDGFVNRFWKNESIKGYNSTLGVANFQVPGDTQCTLDLILRPLNLFQEKCLICTTERYDRIGTCAPDTTFLISMD